MSIVVEDGSGVTGANSYVTEAEFEAYCDARGLTPATGDAEAALVRATQFIDVRYSASFPGSRANGRSQALAWPRSDATDAYDDDIDDGEIPQEIKDAVCEAALRELTEAGSLMPDLERGGAVKRVKAGSVEVEYSGNAPADTTFGMIDGILSGLLKSSGDYTARAVRG